MINATFVEKWRSSTLTNCGAIIPEIPIITNESPIASPNRFSLKWWVRTIIAVLVVNPLPDPKRKESIAQ